jgi:type IV secretory pathway TrbD component
MTFEQALILAIVAGAMALVVIFMMRLRDWPTINERQGVTMGLFAFATLMLFMAREDPRLWEVKLFEVIFQAVVLTGLLNMVVAFHFASNKGSETARANVGKAFDAITAAATGQAPPGNSPGATVEAVEAVDLEGAGPAPAKETKDDV